MWHHYRDRLYIRMLWPSHLPSTAPCNHLVLFLGHHNLLQFLKDKQIYPDMGCFVLTLYALMDASFLFEKYNLVWSIVHGHKQ